MVSDALAEGTRVQCKVCQHTFSIAAQQGDVPTPTPPAPQAGGGALDELAAAVERRKGTKRIRSWPYTSPMTRATIMLVLASLLLVVEITWIWAAGLQLDLLHRIEASDAAYDRLVTANPEIEEDQMAAELAAKGLLVTDEEADANDSRMMKLGYASLAISLAFLFTYFLWKYRAYKNLYSLKARQIRSSPGGAVGWYFCPVANLWKPCQVMNDIWHGSDPAKLERPHAVVSGFVLLWWLVWIANGVIGQIYFRMPEETVDGLIAATYAGRFSTIVSIPSIVLTMSVIWVVSKRQVRRMSLLERGAVRANPYETPIT